MKYRIGLLLIMSIVFLSMSYAISCTVDNPVKDSHNQSFDYTDIVGAGNLYGEKITVKDSTLVLNNITRAMATNATHAYLYDSSMTLLSTTIFTGRDAVFTANNSLTNNTMYYILVSDPDDDWGRNISTAGVTYNFNNTNFNYTYGWNGAADNGNVFCIESIVTTKSVDNILVNSISFNSTSKPGLKENFILNATYSTGCYSSISVNLSYNGTQYASTRVGTGNNSLFTRGLNAFVPYGNKTVYWIIGLTNSSGTSYYNSTWGNQTIQEVPSGVFNSTALESETESFSLSMNYSSADYTSISANLSYNGTQYVATKTGTGNAVQFTKSLGIESPSGNKTVYWIIGLTNSSGTSYFNSSWDNQTVSKIDFGFCNATNSVPYINFTFKDENSGSSINASLDLSTWTYWLGDGSSNKTYLFSNTSLSNPSYSFCFDPAYKTINEVLQYFQYSFTGYPQRQYYRSGTLTNSTTNQILYLLSSAEGLYSTYQTMTSAGNQIAGVTLQIERQFSGVWTQVAQGTTDSSGSATFWLNPSYDHRITASKAGYVTKTETVRPTNSLYSFIMTGGTGNYTYTSNIEGIYYTRGPATGLLSAGLHVFDFNISSSKSNMVNCKFEIVNRSAYILNSSSSACTSNAYLNLTYTMPSGGDLYGRYYVDIGTGWILLEQDANWKDVPTNASSWNTLKGFFTFLSDDTIWTDGTEIEKKKYEYTKIVAFFLIIAVFSAVLNFKFNYELYNPGIFLFGLPLIITILSIYAGVSGQGYFFISEGTGFTLFDNFLLCICSWFLAFSYHFSVTRRT